jgi:ParB-like chromosome segregation protein Spo0J
MSAPAEEKNKVAATFEPIGSLVPWSGNPRRNAHTIAKVAKSIKRFGFGAPLVARLANREIIAGHTRYEAAKSLGLAEVPVRFLDLTERKAHALALADNKLGEDAEWDEEKLADVMRELTEDSLVDEEMLDTGFTDDDIAKLLEEEPLLMDPGVGSEKGESVPAVTFGRWKLPMTNEEAERLATRTKEWIELDGTLAGFIGSLLNDE